MTYIKASIDDLVEILNDLNGDTDFDDNSLLHIYTKIFQLLVEIAKIELDAEQKCSERTAQFLQRLINCWFVGFSKADNRAQNVEPFLLALAEILARNSTVITSQFDLQPVIDYLINQNFPEYYQDALEAALAIQRSTLFASKRRNIQRLA